MAYTLKNTGIAANIAWILAVDDDSAIKGWKTPGAGADWTTSSGLTLGGGGSAPSVVSGTWQGVSTNLIRIPSGGDITIDTAVAVATPYCLFIITRNSNVTWSSVNRQVISGSTTATGAYSYTKPVLVTRSGPQLVLEESEGSYALSNLTHTFGSAENYSVFFCNKVTADADNPSYYADESGTITAVNNTRVGYATTQSGVYWRFISPESGFDGDVVAIGCLTVVPSISEANSIHTDPFGTLFDAGATDFPITADSGSFALTGQTAGLFATRLLTASQGSYSLTGQDATLQKDTPGAFTMPADSGSYSWTGSDALGDYAMNAGSGSYALTGQDVTFSIGVPTAYSMTANTGYYAFNGKNARLDWSGAPIVPNRQAGIYMGMRIGL